MLNLRKVEKLVNENEWNVVDMAELRTGDTFRMTEPDETKPFFMGVASGDACIVTYKNGEPVWGVDTVPSS